MVLKLLILSSLQDALNISMLRSIQIEMYNGSKKNSSRYKQLKKESRFWDVITLNCIKKVINKDVELFNRWNKAYVIYLILMMAIYIGCLAFIIINKKIIGETLIFVCVLKLIVIVVLRIMVFKDGIGHRSKYFKRK